MADGRTVLLAVTEDAQYDIVRDAVAELGLPLVRVEQRRQSLEDLFRDAVAGPDTDRHAADAVSGPAPEPAARSGMTTPTTPPVGAPQSARGSGGSIYDLGYQGYSGPRLGRRSAVLALFTQTFRSSLRDRPRRARQDRAVHALGALAILPAVLAVGFAALAAQAGGGGAGGRLADPLRDLPRPASPILIMLFCAAQAPELFGRDQRYGVLPLYFSRVLTRTDYALAKVGGLMAALFLVEVSPYVVLFVGRVLVAADPITGLSNELPQVPRFVLQAVLVAGLLGGLASLIAAWTPRRAYATAAIIAIFIIPPIIVALVGGLTNQDLARAIILFSPGDVLDGTNSAIFGSIPDSPVVAVARPARLGCTSRRPRSRSPSPSG